MLGKNKSFVIRRLSKAINIEKICPSVTEAGFPLSRCFATIAIFGHTIAISKLFNYYRARDIDVFRRPRIPQRLVLKILSNN